jgi:regulatory protein
LETITDLQPQKRNKDRLNVYIDGEYAFSVLMKLGAGLKIGQQISLEEVSKIKAEDAVSRAKQLSFRYLSYRPRSTAEVSNYLKRKGFDSSVVDDVIDQLQNREYLDDNAFARYWIEQRQTHRPRGAFALRYELLQKGISAEIIATMVDDVNEKDAALRAVERKSGQWKNLPKDQYWRKISGFLQRRGFSYVTISEVAETVWLSIEDGRKA